MKIHVLVPLLTLCTVLSADLIRAADQPATDSPAKTETKAERDARMAWWREAKFGMFIHWGLYSVPAGYYHGKPDGGAGEWIMHNERIPIAEYAAFAPEFDPTKFDADEWVKTAKAAGMKYIVITAKHHEGFAMFHTKVDGYNIYDATPFKRDPIAELAKACKKEGVKFGLYYSQNLDWHHPGGGGNDWDPAHQGDPDLFVKKVVVPQVREILSNYGPISVIWWDINGGVINKDREDLIYKTVEACNPDIIMDNRLGDGKYGDYESPEQHIPPQGYPGKDWETCMTINGTWGFKKDDTNFKSTETLLRNLIDIASKGGNYLLNVGPDDTGTIPTPEVERLKAMGDWLKVNGKAIYGTKGSPFRRQLAWGRATQSPGKLYLSVFDWPQDGKLLVPVSNPVTKAYLLAQPDTALTTTTTTDGVEVQLPAAAPDPIASVVVLKIKGEPVPVNQSLAQAADGSLTLSAMDALIEGSNLQIEGENPSNLGYWVQTTDFAHWPVRVKTPGTFKVTMNYALDPGSAGSTLTMTVADQSLTVTPQPTSGWKDYKQADAGTVTIAKPGDYDIKLTGTTTHPKQGVVNLRDLILTPAAAP